MSAVFDEYSQAYENTVTDSIAFSGLEHDFFLETKAALLRTVFEDRWGPSAKPSLLDIGCGVGRLHGKLRPLVSQLSGSDVSDASLKRAAEENPSNDYRLARGASLPWDAGSFDATVAVCVLHHVEPHSWPAFIAEMRRVTRPGGLVTLIEHNPWNPLTRLAVFRCPFDEDATLLTAARARRLLNAAGCKQVESRHFLVFPMSSGPTRAAERLLSAVPLGAQYLAMGTA